MLAWLKNLFKPKQKRFEDEPEQVSKEGFKSANGMMVETDDQLLADVVTRAFVSGNMVVGNRDEDGNETIKEVK